MSGQSYPLDMLQECLLFVVQPGGVEHDDVNALLTARKESRRDSLRGFKTRLIGEQQNIDVTAASLRIDPRPEQPCFARNALQRGLQRGRFFCIEANGSSLP